MIMTMMMSTARTTMMNNRLIVELIASSLMEGTRRSHLPPDELPVKLPKLVNTHSCWYKFIRITARESYQLEHYKDRVGDTLKMLSCNRFIINSYWSLLTLKVIATRGTPPGVSRKEESFRTAAAASMFFPPDRVRTCVQVYQKAPKATTVRTW